MFFDPGVSTYARAHRLRTARHPKRADVDVGKAQRNEQHGDDGMHTCAAASRRCWFRKTEHSSRKPDRDGQACDFFF